MRKWFLFLTYSVIGIFANTGCGNDYPNNQNFGYRFGYSTYYRPGYARNFNVYQGQSQSTYQNQQQSTYQQPEIYNQGQGLNPIFPPNLPSPQPTPIQTTQEPVETTEEPIQTTQEPVETTQEPIQTTQEPIQTTQEPVQTTQEPVQTTQEPVETTEEPIQTTQEPVETTQEPIQTTQEPVQTTQEPVQTTQEPVETTQAPIQTTQEPIQTTQEPVETTQEPVETTEEPIQTTQEPIQTTQEPIQTTQEPVQTTQKPVETTQAPIQTTQAPDQTTSTPIVPKCPKNSETWKATCYLLMTEDIGITFWHAEGKCNHWAKDGHLASIRSEEENKLVTDLAAKKNIDKEQPWIGGMISEVVGGWAWTDFDPFADFAGYLTNVPAGQGLNCLQLSSNDNNSPADFKLGKWIAKNCETTSKVFVCKKPLM